MQGLNDLGYVDGKNIQFERRVADGNLDRLPALAAAELVRTDVDVILAESSFAVEAARAATKAIDHDRLPAGVPTFMRRGCGAMPEPKF
jgi:putative ABC transport system substrate-binding protein